MRFGLSEILLLAIVILVLFGRGRVANVMGEFGKGIRNFKQGLKGEDQESQKPLLDKKDDV